MSGITIVLRSPEDIQKIKELEEKIKKFEELPPLEVSQPMSTSCQIDTCKCLLKKQFLQQP